MQGNIGQLGKVSIHAPHEGERPLSFVPCGLQPHGFNPRSPRGGATKHGVTIQDVARSFNPRSPRGGATHLFLSSRADSCNGFNPRSPRGGATGKAPDLAKAAKEFQSTLPTRGSDSKHIFYQALQTSFNPRSPRGGATSAHSPFSSYWFYVSIHAPHEGERLDDDYAYFGYRYVSIHAPHEGERRRKSAFVCSISANLLNIIHCGTVTRAVSRRRIALFRLFSVRRSGVFMYAYASH